ncbi:MAG: right-handed parallel beta-helix repeat-containing protein [Thermoplasmata archaeon]|nr:right-handed parallel beta-helix repeat-containing protein [Thermoplasmata archaeon]
MKGVFLGICLAVVVLVCMNLTPAASAADIIVDDDGGPWSDFDNIVDAVAAASGGDNIYVYGGTYNESVVVEIGINLYGNGTEGDDATRVNGSSASKYAFQLHGGSIQLSGMNLTGEVFAVQVLSTGFAVMDHLSVHSVATGVAINDSGFFAIQNSTFYGCDYGIKMWDCSIFGINDNAFRDCEYPLEVESVSSLYVINNTVTESHNGFILKWTNDSTVRANAIEGILVDGINLFECRDDIVGRNVLSCSDTFTSSGIYVQMCSNILFRENKVTDTGFQFYGPRLRHWASHTFDSNKVNGAPVYYSVGDSSLAITGNLGQVIIVNGRYMTVQDVVIGNTSVGVYNVFSDGTALSGVTLSGSMIGAFSLMSNETYLNDTRLSGNYIGSNAQYVVGIEANGVTAEDSSYTGMIYNVCSGVTIDGAVLSRNMYGIALISVDHLSADNVECYSNHIDVYTTGVYGFTIANFTSTGAERSMELYSIQNGEMHAMSIMRATNGIMVYGGSNVTLVDNDIEASAIAVNMLALRFRFWENRFMNGSLFLQGMSLEEWNSHDIPENNTVDGDTDGPAPALPIHYLVDTVNATVTGDYGQVILANCSRVTVTGMSTVGSSVPIIAGFCDRLNITDNTLVAPTYSGFYIESSKGVRVDGNEVIGSYQYGGTYGPNVLDCYILNNTFIDSLSYALWVGFVTDPAYIYWNTFIDNGPGAQVFDWWGSAEWDNGSVGNWWSDYSGFDADRDGIGDTPYQIPTMVMASDRFPTGNFAPELTAWPVTPSNGTPETEFTFTVTYCDPDGNPADSVTVDIMGTSFNMTQGSDAPWTDGVNFTLTTTLGRGEWYFHFNTSDGWRTNTTGTLYGPNVNRLPELVDLSMFTDPGRSIDNYTFYVHYRDDDNDTPVQVVLNVGGGMYDMEQSDENETFYYGGVVFEATVSLAPGNHTYNFSANDGREWNWTNGTGYVRVNDPPMLLDPMISPEWGDNATLFFFTVDYFDTDGDIPSGVWLNVDGIPFEMFTPMNVSEWDGVSPIPYSFNTTLYFGTLEFNFSARDPYEWNTTGNRSVRVNRPPKLRDPVVDPATGNESHTFTFSVTYRDGDNDPPAFMSVTIDTDDFAMSPTTNSTDYVTGVEYSYVTYLGVGMHIYSFASSDGYEDVDTPAYSVEVEESDVPIKPLAYIDAISPSTAEAGETVHMEGHGSGGEITDFEWTSDIDGVVGTEASIDVDDLSVGDHLISLRVRNDDDLWSDPVNGSVLITAGAALPDARVLTLTVLPLEPEEDAEVTIVATASNAGDAPGNFTLGVYQTSSPWSDIDDLTLIATRDVSLDPDETIDITVTWTPSAAGEYTIVVWADPDRSVVELKENNNIRETSVTVAEAEEPPVEPPEEDDAAAIDPMAGIGIALVIVIVLVLVFVLTRRKGERAKPSRDDRPAFDDGEGWYRDGRGAGDEAKSPPAREGRDPWDDGEPDRWNERDRYDGDRTGREEDMPSRDREGPRREGRESHSRDGPPTDQDRYDAHPSNDGMVPDGDRPRGDRPKGPEQW